MPTSRASFDNDPELMTTPNKPVHDLEQIQRWMQAAIMHPASVVEGIAAADARRLAGAPEAAPAEPVAKARKGRLPRHPAWPPFTGPIEHHIQSYIAFADRDHLVNYLRRRALVELA